MNLGIWEDRNTELLRSSVYFSAVCLVFYLYAFPLFELAAGFYGGDGLTFAYAANMAGNACGYLSYSCLVRHGLKQKRIITGAVVGLLFTFAVMFFIKTFALFILTVFIAAALNGVLGALAHWSISMLVYGSPISGRVVGSAYAAALALQYAIVHICRYNRPMALAVGLIIAGAAALIFAPPSNWLAKAAPPEWGGSFYTPAIPVYAISIACVAALTLAYGLYDGISSNLHAHNELNVWSYPRLFSIVGVLAVAWIADIKRRAYLSAAVLCFFTADTTAVLFLRSPATYALSQSLQYLFSGAYIFFLTIIFMDIAPRSKEPNFWAGMGRAVYSAVLIPLLFAGRVLFSRFGDLPIICISMAVFAVTAALFLVRDRIMAADRDDYERLKLLALFQGKYFLTNRETDIVKQLVWNEDTIDTISVNLKLSKRTCQRDISAIYEKSGAQTRTGLIRVFREG